MRVRKGEDIPHTIFDHVFMALIPVGSDKNFRIYSSMNYVKLDRPWKLAAHPLCSSNIIEGLCTELIVMNSFLSVF